MNLKQANTLHYQAYSHEKQQKFEEAYKDMTNMLYSLGGGGDPPPHF